MLSTIYRSGLISYFFPNSLTSFGVADLLKNLLKAMEALNRKMHLRLRSLAPYYTDSPVQSSKPTNEP